MDSVRQHWATFRELARERRFRTPLLLVWMSNFGASLASPALPFFYLRLGLTPVEIGRQAAILAAGTLVTAPAYGWLLDASERGDDASVPDEPRDERAHPRLVRGELGGEPLRADLTKRRRERSDEPWATRSYVAV